MDFFFFFKRDIVILCSQLKPNWWEFTQATDWRGKLWPKELILCLGTDILLDRDAGQPSDLDFQQMSHGFSKPILKWIYINNSLLLFLSNHCSCLCNPKKVHKLLMPPCYIKKKTRKCKSTPLLLFPGPTTVSTFSNAKFSFLLSVEWDCLTLHSSSTEYGVKLKIYYILIPYKQFDKTIYVNW